MKKILIGLVVILIYITTPLRSYAADIVIDNNNILTLAEIQNLVNDVDDDTIRFSTNVDLVGELILPQPATIIVDNNVTVNFNSPNTTDQNKAISSNEILVIENNGVVNFTDYYRSIDLTNSIIINGGEFNFENIRDAGIYSYDSSINDATITTNSTETNQFATLVLGTLNDHVVNITNSDLHLVNNSDSGTSSAIFSNAGSIKFTDSNLYALSKSHYNINFYGDSDNTQVVTYDNTNIVIVTPADSNPNKSGVYQGYNYSFPVNSVGMNTFNTIINFNESNIIHNNDFNTDIVDSIELSSSSININNSSLDIVSLGLDSDGGLSPENYFNVNGCQSELIIDELHGRFNELSGDYEIDNNTFLNNIVLNQGKITIPTPINRTTISHTDQEYLEIISSNNNELLLHQNDGVNDSELETNTYENLSCYGAEYERHEFYPLLSDVINNQNITISETGYRNDSGDFVVSTENAAYNDIETLIIDTTNNDLFPIIGNSDDIFNTKIGDIVNSPDLQDYLLVGVVQQVFDMNGTLLEENDILSAEEALYSGTGVYNTPSITANFEKEKKIVYVYKYAKLAAQKTIHNYFDSETDFTSGEEPIEDEISNLGLDIAPEHFSVLSNTKGDRYKLISLRKDVYDMLGSISEDDDIILSQETETIEITEENIEDYSNIESVEYLNGKKIVYTLNYIMANDSTSDIEDTESTTNSTTSGTTFTSNAHNPRNGHEKDKEEEPEVKPYEIKIETPKKEYNLDKKTPPLQEVEIQKETPKIEVIKKEIKKKQPTPKPIVTPKKNQTLIKQYPKMLPQAGLGTDIYNKVGIFRNNKVVTKLQEDDFRLAGSTNPELIHWLQVLPEEDRDGDRYIVIPMKGVVMPLGDVQAEDEAYTNFINGKTEHFWKYLEKGAVELPGTTANGYGKVGNKVVTGHSSFWKNAPGNYKTQFQHIININMNEEIWIYERDETGKMQRYIYEAFASYETSAFDTAVLKSTGHSQLTLLTCTPIGGITGRWVVKAKFSGIGEL